MRLTKLKLAGFKTFVDPTSILTPGQLVGVVGPNGCGKSNVIDAVRWVLGESKATALRGESMQDVIFNGSGQRKPVGRASVELHFDNSQGRASGQWSQYAEIAVKRVLDRDGESSYYINNLHVRRRDVIDLFMGTGLGPRAYAIIEQGMISRIIEAKPEELRFFLEEAAGVTKYKERRRETENRLSDARENLARVEDIRNELGHQIEKLEGQAEVARQYHELHAQLTRRQNLLWLYKRNEARDSREKLARNVEQAVIKLEAETASLRELEARVETARGDHYAASDALHAAQGEMFAANAEVARLESELNHLRDLRQKVESRLAQLESEDGHWRGQAETLDRDEARWKELLENAAQRAQGATARHAEAAARLPEAESALKAAEEAAQGVRRELAQAEQGLRVEEAHKSHADKTLESLGQRRGRLETERGQIEQPDTAALAALQARVAELNTQVEARRSRVEELQRRLPEHEAQRREAADTQASAARRLTEALARRDALKQLQSRVQQEGKLGDWLKRHGLDAATPIWASLKVEPGWETALEAVLRERLGALAGVDQPTAERVLADPPPATLALVFAGDLAAAGETAGLDADVPLRDKVRCVDPRWEAALTEWLAGVYVADDLAGLAARRAGLPGGRMWVSQAGHLVSRHGFVLYVPEARTHGVIERQREIEQLEAECAGLEDEAGIAAATLAAAESGLAEHRGHLTEAQREAQELQQTAHAAQVEAVKLGEAVQRYEARVAQINADLGEIAAGEDTERSRRQIADSEVARLTSVVLELRGKLEAAIEESHKRDAALREQRTVEQALSRELQESRFAERECTGKLEEIGRSREVAREQLERIVAETAARRQEGESISEGATERQLQQALSARQGREGTLASQRDALEGAAAELRQLEEARLKTEQGLNPLRDRIGDLRLKEQAAQLNEEQYAARLAEANASEEELTPELTRELREPLLAGDIARLSAEIEALGAVNLAALDELNTSRERKGFLDSQTEDLTQAIDTLEDAIRRIDRETREQLQDTYNNVNRQFGILFPQLFGGGEARLILTGEEILDSGIQVMAQPPGKKNSTIHLLSGGEKALTAIALVFSLFQLNPAPFCMLDEVDAPLDDSNTERFCEMVKRMSAQTQFLFITHNKITMEMARQLVGVTMQEQGVSRVVEVDIEEALRMSDEAVPA
ncbi:MAG: chromosome segregation protein SMC [Rhodocyclaceae bacterium]|nr:chromosome segregation protein SMC [Zoogloeaceae bacterium]MCQ3924965.1 chromosome segregation protein SMC [Rhodocyclaceae bacterium]HNQ58327.1 chromosome segregation protein SMC [Candidatus Desulfobacillus denitrificans]HNT63136.1 chromosome segregation protein SMC [Candidatus Desulfobacillus denitrificans]